MKAFVGASAAAIVDAIPSHFGGKAPSGLPAESFSQCYHVVMQLPAKSFNVTFMAGKLVLYPKEREESDKTISECSWEIRRK